MVDHMYSDEVNGEPRKKSSEVLLLLTHIPKTCGTSFRYSLVYPNIPRELVYKPKNGWRSLLTTKKDFQFIVGHFEVVKK